MCVDADDAEAMELVRTRCPATPLTTQARSDGCHYWYRRLETTEKVKSRNRTRIGGHIYKLDIKADGGYAVAPGNEHWAGGRYTWSMPWTRELIESLPVYDPSWLPHEEKAREKWEQGEVGRGGANRPGDDFNRRALWDTILEPAGWTYAGGNKWCRPGGFGHSANILGDDDDYLYVWSSNAKPFEAEQAYSKFAAYTVLYHNGNWSRAAEILAEEGYGAVDEARIEEMVEPLVAMESTPPTPPPAAAPASEKKKGATTVQKLMALGGLAAYYHDATETAYASFVVNEHRENWRVRSSIFRR